MALDQQLIVSHAFEVLNGAGLEGLTLRRLATHLNVQAPALYWHFRNKQALLDEMATEVMRRAIRKNAHLEAERDWRVWATAYYQGLRKTLLQYRDGAKMFSGTYLTDTDLFAPMEVSLRRLASVGFSLREAVVGTGALYSYTIGFVIEEQATQFAPGEANPQYDLAEREKRVDKDLYPLAWAAGAELFAKHEARFIEGLALIITGMSAQLQDRRRGLTNPA
ncbi:MAG TPA: TetR/AcrR family transcriptional regulator C-terminal domain-containing protein [Terracidiphilus sp.]|jgi:TetR/AcrR family tetracycline transcriptional repressor|nr:TetR/AcrR family transcriptional regulator C-terminal domain-containing protein [Terracidiphilus sp.]